MTSTFQTYTPDLVSNSANCHIVRSLQFDRAFSRHQGAISSANLNICALATSLSINASSYMAFHSIGPNIEVCVLQRLCHKKSYISKIVHYKFHQPSVTTYCFFCYGYDRLYCIRSGGPFLESNYIPMYVYMCVCTVMDSHGNMGLLSDISLLTRPVSSVIIFFLFPYFARLMKSVFDEKF